MKNVIAAIGAGAVLGAAVTYTVIDRDRPDAAPAVVRDIVQVPKMTPAAAEKHREDRYENLNSIEQILALPTDFGETEALYVLAGRSDSGSVQNLIYEAKRIANPLDREGAVSILLSRLTELDPESALAMARSSTFGYDRNIEVDVWRGWGRFDIDDALQAANSQSTVGQRNIAAQSLYSAFGYMGNEITDKIERELGIRPDKTSRGRFIYNMADRSPEDTIRFIEQMDSSRDRQESVS
jgi:hypothetical protein